MVKNLYKNVGSNDEAVSQKKKKTIYLFDVW